MKIADMFPSEYLRGIDLSQPLALTIAGCAAENVKDRDTGEVKQEFVLKFKETPKKLRLSVTKAKDVAYAVNDTKMDTDNWIGKKIGVFGRWEKHFGKQQFVANVREVKPGDVNLAASATKNGNQPPSQKQPRPLLTPAELKKNLALKASKSQLKDRETGEWLPITMHPFGPKTAQLISAKFQSAAGSETAYHVALEWLTDETSASDLTAAWADALLDWLLNGNKDQKFKADVVDPAPAEAQAVYDLAVAEELNAVSDIEATDQPAFDAFFPPQNPYEADTAG